MNMRDRENKFLGTWVPQGTADKVKLYIESGVFLNYADFLRQAIRNELDRLNKVTKEA
ncbi:MAG: hypothetical protein ACTSW1_10775 [Candidatus Hodarchaeales archaeon]